MYFCEVVYIDTTGNALSTTRLGESSPPPYRDGTEAMCKKLQDANVPMLVFSAGMGDILVEVLRHFKVYTDNVKVVSNFFKYSDEVQYVFVFKLIDRLKENNLTGSLNLMAIVFL